VVGAVILQVAVERQTSLEADLASSRQCCSELQMELSVAAQHFNLEHAEWLQLQKDLQVAVVVANDFRTEAQLSYEAVVAENQSLRDKVVSLTRELMALHQQLSAFSKRLSLLNVFSKLSIFVYHCDILCVCLPHCDEAGEVFYD